jgi:hypothetical protein
MRRHYFDKCRLPTNGSKRQRTAALHDLAEEVARNPSRPRLGVRLSSAAFAASVRMSLRPDVAISMNSEATRQI